MILAAGAGFHVPEVTELFTWKTIASFHLGGITFKVTAMTLIMFAVTGLLMALFTSAFANAQVIPGGLQNVMESGVGFVRENIVYPVIGPEGERWMPFLTTMFFFTFALNFLEVIPGIQFPITSRMAYPAFMSVLVWVIFNAVGIKEQGFVHYFKGMLFPPGVPKPIYVILTPIEFFSTIVVRPITLAVRLFANMMAGHVMLTIFFVATGYFLYRSDSLFLHVLSPFPFVLSIILIGFEMFIALVQAFIITVLTAVYIDEALHPAH